MASSKRVVPIVAFLAAAASISSIEKAARSSRMAAGEEWAPRRHGNLGHVAQPDRWYCDARMLAAVLPSWDQACVCVCVCA